jgi:hypothetical protein
MEPIRISPYTLIYIWVGVGIVAGLILLLTGWSKGRTKLGALGLLSSTVGGGLLGIFLIVPVFAIFLWLIFRSPKDTSPTAESVDSDPSDPAVVNDYSENPSEQT